MAAGTNATLLADLLDPEVVADFIDKKLTNAIRLAPLANLDYTLVGRPGDELTFPSYTYIGDAAAVPEGTDIPISKLAQTSVKVKVSKIGRAVEFSDEALLSGAGNIAEEAAKQVLTAINSKVDADLLSAMSTSATLTHTIATGTDLADGISDALVQFGEDIDGDKVLVIPANAYGDLRKTKNWIPNTEIGADMIVRGAVGMVHGCAVITSDRLTTDAYIIKPGALKIVMKRDTLVEFDRDIISEMNYIKASKLFAPYVYDTSKLIKVTL